VFPTWLAVREHTPVEAEKNYGSEEEITQEGLDNEDKNKITVVRANEHWAHPWASTSGEH
jgi:hypothetical protein